jgi:hypothetical protein
MSPCDISFGAAMSKLLIKDLPESIELDRAAMTAIVGGARTGGHFFGVTAQALPAATRVVDYPVGFPTAARQPVDERIPSQSLLRK